MVKKIIPQIAITNNIIALSIASTAFIIGCLSLPYCNFVSLSTILTVYNGNSWQIILSTTLGLGLWSYQSSKEENGGLLIQDTCVKYDTDNVDVNGAWSASRAFGILALIIGGLNVLFGYWLVYRRRSSTVSNEHSHETAQNTEQDTEKDSPTAALCGGERTQSHITGALYIVTSIYQGFTLFFLLSSICTGESELNLSEIVSPAEVIYGECTMSVGAIMALASTILWFIAGVFLFIPPLSFNCGGCGCVAKLRKARGEKVDTAEEGRNDEEEAVIDTEKAVNTTADTEDIENVVADIDTAIDIVGCEDTNTKAVESESVAAETQTEYVGTVREEESHTQHTRSAATSPKRSAIVQSKKTKGSPTRKVPQTRRRRVR